MSWREEYAEIQRVFNKFVKAWETRDVKQFDDCMIPAPIIEYNMFSIMYSREQLKEKLGVLTRQPTYTRFSVQNFACLIKGNKAQQSASLVALFADDSQEEYASLEFTGVFCNGWEKFEDGWKMVTSKFDWLTDTSSLGTRDPQTYAWMRIPGNGDLSFVKDWKPIKNDPLEFCRPAICAELDSPWFVIRDPDNEMTDEEYIRDMFNRYIMGVDYNCQTFFVDLFAKDCLIRMAQLGDNSPENFIRNGKENKKFATRSHHCGYFVNLEIKGDRAFAKVYRTAPDEPGPYIMCKELERVKLVNARYDIELRKDEGKWKFTYMNYMPGPFIVGKYED